MKTLITAIAVFLTVHTAASTVENRYSFSMRVGRGGIGHGCAVNGLTITAAHMVDRREKHNFSAPPRMYFRYEFEGGQVGRGFSVQHSRNADLAIVSIDKDPPYGYATLAPKPKIGDKVTWFEYDFRKNKNIMKKRSRKSKIIQIISGLVLLKDKASGGASGGCVFNENGHVIGLVTFTIKTEDNKRATGITGLWGDWWQDVDE